MSYWLEDENGWLGDLATNKGIVELREGAVGPLAGFLDRGYADTEQVAELIGDDAVPVYVKEMLDGAESPVTITDGCGGKL